MNNMKIFYKNTENLLPNRIVRRFISMNVVPGKAIDLGCGAGRDSVYLIKNGWNVLAIDREDTSKLISDKLNIDELKKFRFELYSFENVLLEKNNLLVANYSLPFCALDNFYELWHKISSSILKDGYFVGNFFGVNDSWRDKFKIIFLTKEQVLQLFEEMFDIIFFREIEKDVKSGIGEMKHLHLYNVIAKKK